MRVYSNWLYNENKTNKNVYMFYGVYCTCYRSITVCRGLIMVTSSNGNIFRVTGPLCGEITGHRWISLTKASDAEPWYFLWSAPEPTSEQTMKTPVIWDAIVPIMTSLQCNICHISCHLIPRKTTRYALDISHWFIFIVLSVGATQSPANNEQNI